MRSEANAKRWFDHIEAWQKSSVSQSEYCRLNKLSVKSFSSWKLKQARHPKETLVTPDAETPIFTTASAPVLLIPVAISEQMESAAKTELNTRQQSNTGFSGITLIFKKDYQISLAIGFHPGTLKNVLQLFAE